MKCFIGIDLGSTTTKAVMLDERGEVLGRGITNSRSNYDLAAAISRSEAMVSARFALLDAELKADTTLSAQADKLRSRLQNRFKRLQHVAQLDLLHSISRKECQAERVAHIQGQLTDQVDLMMQTMRRKAVKPSLMDMGKAEKKTSDFFRDRAAGDYSRLAEKHTTTDVSFDDLMSIFDKAIIQVENTPLESTFDGSIKQAFEEASERFDPEVRDRCAAAVDRALGIPMDIRGVIGTGYGRQRLPFPREDIRSEILCHGLGAHAQFPNTRTVLDIGGQDTKAIQVDGRGIVTSFQMNDRCAAGCGRYLGYIADEMSLGVHELGPLAMKSERHVKISSTCTVFAGAELRDRLTLGQKREDILAGLHRAIILRAMSLLARSGGVRDEFTFTGGVANNPAAVRALKQLVFENYGERTLNISPGSIYTGALGAALFCLRAETDQMAA